MKTHVLHSGGSSFTLCGLGSQSRTIALAASKQEATCRRCRTSSYRGLVSTTKVRPDDAEVFVAAPGNYKPKAMDRLEYWPASKARAPAHLTLVAKNEATRG